MYLAVLLFAADFSLEIEKDVAPPEGIAPAIAKLLERRRESQRAGTHTGPVYTTQAPQ